MSMMATDVAQQIAMAAAIATIKSLRGEDPGEVARLCAFIDEHTGLPEGSWAPMLAGLVGGRTEWLAKTRRGGASKYPIVNAIANQDQRGLRLVEEKPAEPDPNAPFWMR